MTSERKGVLSGKKSVNEGSLVNSQRHWTKGGLSWCAGAAELSFECEIQVFTLCLTSTGETLNTAQGNTMKCVEFLTVNLAGVGRRG